MREIPRDERDDGNAISGVFYALPPAVALWAAIVLVAFAIVRAV